ncbi:DUF1259 domain-containing protein [Streptomyces sp. NPDC005989]|uniref:DUF1259 domain-containing protein n=1 Tax=Streptomyces sp. NPDC005989 TaxID=3156727 RepID=UPI0033F56541
MLPPALGITTGINFQPMGGNKAAINGDFVMTAPEVQKVIRALRKGDIDIVELHNHSLTDQPRLFYLHFWATPTASPWPRRCVRPWTRQRRPLRRDRLRPDRLRRRAVGRLRHLTHRRSARPQPCPRHDCCADCGVGSLAWNAILRAAHEEQLEIRLRHLRSPPSRGPQAKTRRRRG